MRNFQVASVVLAFAACGCGDNLDNILRDARNRKSEMIEILLQVNTEEDAKVAQKTTLKKATDKFNEIIKGRLELWEKTKKLEDVFNRINTLMTRDGRKRFNLKSPDREGLDKALGKLESGNKALALPVYEAMMAFTKDEEAALARLEKASGRLKQIVERLKLAKEEELRNQGQADPVVEPKDYWPTLVALQDVDRFKMVTVSVSGIYAGGGPSGGMPGGAGGGGGGPGMPGGPK